MWRFFASLDVYDDLIGLFLFIFKESGIDRSRWLWFQKDRSEDSLDRVLAQFPVRFFMLYMGMIYVCVLVARVDDVGDRRHRFSQYS